MSGALTNAFRVHRDAQRASTSGGQGLSASIHAHVARGPAAANAKRRSTEAEARIRGTFAACQKRDRERRPAESAGQCGSATLALGRQTRLLAKLSLPRFCLLLLQVPAAYPAFSSPLWTRSMQHDAMQATFLGRNNVREAV